MNTITILTDFYYPKPLANGICVHEIAKEFIKRNYYVNIVCFKTLDVKEDNCDLEGINVVYVRNSVFHILREYGEKNINKTFGKFVFEIALLIHRVESLLFLPIYPMSTPLFAHRYYRKTRKVVQDSNSEILISVYNPIEALYAGYIIKKHNKDIKWVIYTLDTLSNKVKKKFLPQQFTNDRGWEWEKKLYSKADTIFNMKSHESHYNNDRYKPYKMKMKIVDIPLFKIEKQSKEPECKVIKDDKLRFIYTGALDLGFRNPKYLCELILEYSRNHNIEMSFYSRGNCENLLKSFETISNGQIKRYGYVEPAEVERSRNNADFLVSIGNKNTDMIPSKIFEYMSTGKPIIHFYSGNDSSIKYLEKYPLVLLINEKDDFNLNLRKLIDFESRRFERVDKSKLLLDFELNTSKYIVDIIDF